MSLAPGATIGIIGGGQLGRMSAMAAARLGYRVCVFSPEGMARPPMSRRVPSSHLIPIMTPWPNSPTRWMW